MNLLSVYAHSTETHSANTSYPLVILNTEAFRVAGIGKKICNLMSMQDGTFRRN